MRSLPHESDADEAQLKLAEEAWESATSDPESARELASWLLVHSDSPLVRTTASRALGVALRTLRDGPGMLAAFNDAIEIADQAALLEERAFTEVLLAGGEFLSGRPDRALELLDSAIPDLQGERLVLARMQVGIVRGLSGDFTGGLAALDEIRDQVGSLPVMRQGMYHTNRASCLLATNRAGESIDAFEHALDLYDSVGESHLASNALHNLARAYAAAGQVVGALRCFERIDALDIGPPSGVDLVDRASVFLSAGLLEEAEDAARRARDAAALGGSAEWHPVASMILAQTLDALGDTQAAIDPAREAMELFDQQSRPNLRDLAEAVELRCIAATEGGDHVADRAHATANRLLRWGAATDALTLRLGVARRSDDETLLRSQLGAALEIDADGVESGLLGAEATSRLAVLDGDFDRMSVVLAEAFESLDEWRRTIGSTELQARVARQGVHLADIGIGVAVQRGDAAEVLETVERLRALSLVSTIDRPRNEELDRLLVEYRALGGHLETGERQEGKARLEARIRELGRLVDQTGATSAQPDVATAFSRLVDRRLVEFVDHRGLIYAITTSNASTMEMSPVADSVDIRREIDSVRSAIARLASPQISHASRDAFATVLDASSRYLSEWLFGSIDLEGTSSILVVPSRSLGYLPWSALPALSDKAFTVAPSLRRWAAMDTRPRHDSERVVAVGLDDPPFASAEARMVADLRNGNALVGSDAQVDVVMREIDGAAVAHLACHGVFRSDNPLMSSLHMADGPITVYDLERLGNPPATLILSACEVAQSQRLAGDALLGMTASLMAAGTRSIVAATTVVADRAAPGFMAEWHTHHAEGASPAEALAVARSSVGDDPQARAVAASFLCLGV